MSTKTTVSQALVALVVTGILVAFSIWYTARSQQIADQRWCALLVGLDTRYQALPGDADQSAKELAARIHVLRGQLHCPPSALPQVVPDPTHS